MNNQEIDYFEKSYKCKKLRFFNNENLFISFQQVINIFSVQKKDQFKFSTDNFVDK